MTARRLLRWLRLVVATLAFVVASPPPAMAADAFGQVVFVASEGAREETREEAREDARREAHAEVASAEPEAIARGERPGPRFDSPRLVSRRWLKNCAFLL